MDAKQQTIIDGIHQAAKQQIDLAFGELVQAYREASSHPKQGNVLAGEVTQASQEARAEVDFDVRMETIRSAFTYAEDNWIDVDED